jgi:hypothetical protein
VMCFRTAKAQNNARAKVLDMGIVILGAPPFLILAGFIAFVFSKDKAGQGAAEEDSFHHGDTVNTEIPRRRFDSV